MRLDNKTCEIIKSEVASLIGTDSVVRLFGSRVDDEQRGGDIDLLIASPRAIENRVQAECRLAARLYIKLGGRKVDVLIKDDDTLDRPVYQQAIRYGVVL
jgi:predicted nucleotidyltransferase